MNIKMGRSWTKKLEKRIEGFELEVGILEDKPHNNPVEHGLFGDPQTRTYAGGPVRKQTREKGPLSTGEIFIQNQERLNIDLLLRPFQEKSSDIMKFTSAFLKTAVAKGSTKRVENLLQAIVRNPILKQEYGGNRSATADAKGFDRHLFDTGQMFKAIVARVKRRV